MTSLVNSSKYGCTSIPSLFSNLSHFSIISVQLACMAGSMCWDIYVERVKICQTITIKREVYIHITYPELFKVESWIDDPSMLGPFLIFIAGDSTDEELGEWVVSWLLENVVVHQDLLYQIWLHDQNSCNWTNPYEGTLSYNILIMFISKAMLIFFFLNV